MLDELDRDTWEGLILLVRDAAAAAVKELDTLALAWSFSAGYRGYLLDKVRSILAWTEEVADRADPDSLGLGAPRRSLSDAAVDCAERLVRLSYQLLTEGAGGVAMAASWYTQFDTPPATEFLERPYPVRSV